MKLPLTRIEWKIIRGGCGMLLFGSIMFFLKLIIFHGISGDLIQSIQALGAALIAAVLLVHYEVQEDLEDEELERRGRFPILPKDHPLQQINEGDPVLHDRRFKREFPNREAPDPQSIDEENDPRLGRNDQVGLSRSTLIGIAESGGPGTKFEEEVVHQRYSPIESGPLTDMPGRTPFKFRNSERLLPNGTEAGVNDDFGVFADDQRPEGVRLHRTTRQSDLVEDTGHPDGFEASAFEAHLPLKSGGKELTSAAK